MHTLAFANNAEGQDAAAELYAETYFFGNLNTAVGDPEWCFVTIDILIR